MATAMTVITGDVTAERGKHVDVDDLGTILPDLNSSCGSARNLAPQGGAINVGNSPLADEGRTHIGQSHEAQPRLTSGLILCRMRGC